jgi:DNA helicase-2/ATP-dependent DNA helicase PcrA
VTLMTVHAAKGLEYPVVFITGMEEGVFPHYRALDDNALEEERRLFYVGVTRARKQLYLTAAQERLRMGAPISCEPSCFLDEIPQECLRKLSFY